MPFKDLGDWTELAALKLPIGGKVYTVPPLSIELGPKLQQLVSAGQRIVAGLELNDRDREALSVDEVEIYTRLLGPAFDEMRADNVPWPALKHAAMTALISNAVDHATAEKFWATMGKPPAKKTVKAPADRQPGKAGGKRKAS